MSETGKLCDKEFLHWLDDSVDYKRHALMLIKETPKSKVWIDGKRIKTGG